VFESLVTDFAGMSQNLDILIPVPATVELLQYLQCPLCSNRMAEPITFCDNGHNICSDCKDIMDKCPTCGAKFNGIRNINLENISQWSNFSCENFALGCPVMRPIELMADHLASCKYSKASCPVNKVMSIVCPWEGLLKDVISHCSVSHQKHFAEGEIFMSPSTEDAANIVLYDDEIFIYKKRFIDGKLYCAVMKGGKSQTLYTVSYILNTVNGSERVVFTHIISEISASFNGLLNSGKFLKLNDKLVKRFTSDGKLALQVMIMRVTART
jgi:E3 ubiquitin-protein ligase SIAH1